VFNQYGDEGQQSLRTGASSGYGQMKERVSMKPWTKPTRVMYVLVLLMSIVFVVAACADNGNGAEPTPDEPAAGPSPTPQEPEPPAATPTPGEPEPTPTPADTALETPAPAPVITPTPTDDERLMIVSVYFVRDERIGAAHRQIPRTQQVATAAINELLNGTTGLEESAGLSSEVPGETRLLGISIDNGTATIDLSSEFESGGGSLSMTLRVAQIVYTLTQFPTVDDVLFHIDGQAVDAIGGEGIVVDPPVGRADFEDVTPAIFVESPTPGDEVTSPLRLWGTANTFEATFMIQIVDNSGAIVYEHHATATSGTGERGTFDVTVPFDATREGFGSLIVFESSARDGSAIHIVEIPIDIRF
jgi:germination protein M